ncbi:transglycosylase SLT domain-containing protein [Spirilliplanes yamanashiensis]|uniref:Transglycosylase SLT domain-containing protein n=1 Tax=Spirilliplanes yamanashiensis TaxID=42233 RepID=A0A8J4DH59_9ACTN|nr:transglycosylase SLT domain-containing protein [Spirilliplanes yamanashiensis]MDP9814119.1 hypothetical protein [Spirilliplanes yamanashiensis]GIJ00900.1 hypothetical protein Sya03_02520 [Spirilliplanes yamanashiensis]
MSRLWSRVGIRALAVALLVTGVIGGVYLGQDHQTQQRTAAQDEIVLTEQAELDLLKERHAEHAAARASQRAAQADAAEKAASAAKAAAAKSRKLEAAVIKKKAAEKKAAEEKKKAAAGDGATVPFTGPIPESCGEYKGNRATACALLVDRGYSLEQMACLDKLWTKESGFNHKAQNRSSGAYGIPQSLPGSKMASAGSDWRTNPATQIKWGLGYIKGRYKTPCAAWGHSQDVGWY